jgi:hypothetical protein
MLLQAGDIDLRRDDEHATKRELDSSTATIIVQAD